MYKILFLFFILFSSFSYSMKNSPVNYKIIEEKEIEDLIPKYKESDFSELSSFKNNNFFNKNVSDKLIIDTYSYESGKDFFGKAIISCFFPKNAVVKVTNEEAGTTLFINYTRFNINKIVLIRNDKVEFYF
jgi:hypothetical protein